LKIWPPWIILKRQTPRSVKRYKKHGAKFYNATAQRRCDDEQRPAWKRFLQGLKKETAENEAQRGSPPDEWRLQEPLLVTLLSIHHCNNNWVEDDALFRIITERGISELFDELVGDSMYKPCEKKIQELASAINQLTIDFSGTWPSTDEQRQRFIKLSRGIRTF
jgi:hypothetical protein